MDYEPAGQGGYTCYDCSHNRLTMQMHRHHAVDGISAPCCSPQCLPYSLGNLDQALSRRRRSTRQRAPLAQVPSLRRHRWEPASATFSFTVLTADGTRQPISGATVTFTAGTSGGASGTFANGTNTTTAVSGANGDATSSTFTANNTAGMYTLTGVAACPNTPANTQPNSSPNFIFLTNTANNPTGMPAQISAGVGNNQAAQINTAFGTALNAIVQDGNGNNLSGRDGHVHGHARRDDGRECHLCQRHHRNHRRHRFHGSRRCIQTHGKRNARNILR